ncbi:MAG TPA: nicotinate phosphoribosyltransferase [Spirochaetia bacterium]|nr:nicotinate phosphoribosyltransferase [Spirochaetia bacterium]
MGIRSALLTDLYELTMIQGYFFENMRNRVVFDMFFREQPFDGGFSVFAGLDDVIRELENLSFTGDDIAYLASLQMFRPEFLDFLASFRFHGDLYAMDEGTIVFPNEPLVRIHGDIIEAQLIESMLLNILNFQTLIATKSARVRVATDGRGEVMEFGLRRAQGVDGAMSATRAAYIGGSSSTSNTLGGKLFGIPVSGTMAHSWIMAFKDELTAFSKFAEYYPDHTVLLIDTYDTLDSGIENAIQVGKLLTAQGKKFGVRLDSGDLHYLSVQVRKRLDDAGLTKATIAVSNELNEEIIHELVRDGAPIDYWGVGTHLVTGGNSASLTGVYKLASVETEGGWKPVLKMSNNPAKMTNPGAKQVYRFLNGGGSPIADLLVLESEDPAFLEKPEIVFHHPAIMERGNFVLREWSAAIPLLHRKMENGKRLVTSPALPEIHERAAMQVASLDKTFKRFLNPHIYKVSLSGELKEMKADLIRSYRERYYSDSR